MSISDTSLSKKYASISESAAAQAKLYANKLENAPDYAEQAAASAAAAESSAQMAINAEMIVNNLVISASESATSASASAAEAGNAAAAAVSQCVRVPEGESIAVLPSHEERSNSFLTFGPSGDVQTLEKSKVAVTGDDGKIPGSMIPSMAISETYVVNSLAEMLALNANVGDVAKRADLGVSFILSQEPSSSESNWVQLNDDVLNQLAQSDGASLIGFNSETLFEVAGRVDKKLNGSYTFSSGGALQDKKDFIYSDDLKCWFYWSGAFPKTVDAGTNPYSTGGIGSGAWIPVSEVSLSPQLSFGGTKYYNKGAFSPGVVIYTKNDVVTDPSTGWFYSYLGTIPHTISSGDIIDVNWKALGNMNGYPYNHIQNWTNTIVTTEVALTAAFNTGLEVDVTGASVSTAADYTAPSGARGLYGRGSITLGGNFRLQSFDFPTLTTFSQPASAGHSEVYLDGVDHTGSYVVIDNGYPFCIDEAEKPSTPADSIDGIALTKNLNGYQSQFIQITEIIGHTTANKAILAQPLVVNQVSGTAKYGFASGNLTSFKIRDGVTMKSSNNTMRRFMLLAQIKPEVIGCIFHNIHVEMRYYCYSGRFERNRLTGNVPESMFSFATSSSVCSVKDNFCSTLGLNDSTIGFYRQVCYVNCVGNIVNDPLISTAYTNDHWGIMFHSMVYHSLMADNVVTARAGITSQFFCDEVIITGNKVSSFLITASYNNNVTYNGNDFSYISDMILQGNSKFTSKGNQYRIRGGATTNCISIISGAKPFGMAGFKVINSSDHEFCADDFMATVRNTFVNPKTLMLDPTTAGTNSVFPLNNSHMNNQTGGLSVYDARVASVRVNSCNFTDLNYGVNCYKNNSAVSATYLDISDSSFNTDVGVCLRGISSASFYTGQIRTCIFLGTFGAINANTNGYALISSSFRGLGMSAILVASNITYAFGLTMSSDCSVAGSILTGFKWYDFNGYQSSYDRTVTYSKASTLPGGYWWYAPDENLGISANIPYEYTKGATSSGGVLLRKALTVTQVV
ncbi:hypothetical protein [Lelliottia sp. JS-SCA-14]|uniref:tail fiber/spike domain-containing protein n=1 Tax=Lelliottia sp. JS-SCA-14 TaxID=3110110 RepID=UPI002D788CA9|nr:hypothetical protein [Lelliottia sp. JS-SCA-14]